MLKDVQDIIMRYFASHKLVAGDVLDELTTRYQIKAKLTPEDIKNFPRYIQSLQKDDLIDYIEERGRYQLILTRKGFELIYPIRDNAIDLVYNTIREYFTPPSVPRARMKETLPVAMLELFLQEVLNPHECEIRIYKLALLELEREDLIFISKDKDALIIHITQRGKDHIGFKSYGW